MFKDEPASIVLRTPLPLGSLLPALRASIREAGSDEPSPRTPFRFERQLTLCPFRLSGCWFVASQWQGNSSAFRFQTKISERCNHLYLIRLSENDIKEVIMAALRSATTGNENGREWRDARGASAAM